MISDKRNISVKYLFEFELSPAPAALFDDYGLMRKTSKSQLMKKVTVVKHSSPPIEATIIDGNEQIYHVTWPKTATVDVFVQYFGRAIDRAMESDSTAVESGEHQMFVVFDRYFDLSIKNHERDRRSGSTASGHHKLTKQTILHGREAIMKSKQKRTHQSALYEGNIRKCCHGWRGSVLI